VFIAVGFVGEPAYWWDVLAHLAYGSGGGPGELARAAERAGIVVEQSAPEPDLDGIHLQLYEAVRALPASEINVALERLSEALGVTAPVPSQRPMTPAELRRFSAHPLITVGAHTVLHPRLTDVDPSEVRREMTSSRHELGQLLGTEPTAFAYPYGAASDAVAAVAHDVGYTTAVTTSGRWLRVRPNRLLVGRLDPGDRDGDELETWLRHWA
jgi:peptidoglycan/xylan/chitin deacetylase (PgdA/CDA1 family)